MKLRYSYIEEPSPQCLDRGSSFILPRAKSVIRSRPGIGQYTTLSVYFECLNLQAVWYDDLAINLGSLFVKFFIQKKSNCIIAK